MIEGLILTGSFANSSPPLSGRGPLRPHNSIGHEPCRCPFPSQVGVHTARTGLASCASPTTNCQSNIVMIRHLYPIPDGGDRALATAGGTRTGLGSHRHQPASATGVAARRGAFTSGIPLARKLDAEPALRRSRASCPHESERSDQRFRGRHHVPTRSEICAREWMSRKRPPMPCRSPRARYDNRCGGAPASTMYNQVGHLTDGRTCKESIPRAAGNAPLAPAGRLGARKRLSRVFRNASTAPSLPVLRPLQGTRNPCSRDRRGRRLQRLIDATGYLPFDWRNPRHARGRSMHGFELAETTGSFHANNSLGRIGDDHNPWR